MIRELKTEKGKLSFDQECWGVAIGALWAVWRPSDWPDIEATLTARRVAVNRSAGTQGGRGGAARSDCGRRAERQPKDETRVGSVPVVDPRRPRKRSVS